MGLADSGGSSALIGSSWSDIVSDHIGSLIGAEVGIPGDEPYRVEQVILTGRDAACRIRSVKALSCKNLILCCSVVAATTSSCRPPTREVLDRDSAQQAGECRDADALASVGPAYTDHLGEWRANGVIVPGLFLRRRAR
ncbi:MAG: hypothetical protein R2855_16435 [Thermomicrobiales bacterium]